jgi:hypothetical protein
MMKRILTVLVSTAALASLAHCGGPADNVNTESCAAVQSGEVRTAVNNDLGKVGGGGGGDDWCDIWYGDYASGPCCAVALTNCGADGTVTGVHYYPAGCNGEPAP